MEANYKLLKTVDLGTDGMFGPGSEARFLKKIEKLGDEGQRILTRLIDRDALECVPTRPGSSFEVTEAPRKETSDKDSENHEDSEESEKESTSYPDYEPTGKYELNDLGGNTFVISDPKGYITGEPIKGKKKANAELEQLNKEVD